jgi:tetratricopeptide (TPR) repeat protein
MRKLTIALIIPLFILTPMGVQSATDLLQLADDFYYNAQYENAIAAYSKYIGQFGDISEIMYRVGLCHFLLEQHEKARELLQKAKDINPAIFNRRIFKISNGGMIPTLIIGDNILSDPDYYFKRDIFRGDVIIFKYPYDHKRTFIKRAIGLPGETMTI